MAKVKIIRTPPGEAPEQIREQWIGLELPVAERVPRLGMKVGLLTESESPHNSRSSKDFIVETVAALVILDKKSPEAARWFRDNPVVRSSRWLIFDATACELID